MIPVGHPFLFAVFPIISMWSSNAGQVSIEEVAAPVTLAVLACTVLWFALAPVIRARNPRAILLSAFWLIFFCYGTASDYLHENILRQSGLYELRIAAFNCTLLIAAAAFVYWLIRTSREFSAITRFLNGLACISLIFAFGRIGYWSIQGQLLPRTSLHSQSTSNHQKPNIFLVILDSYARADFLRDELNFDNAPFLDALRSRGFYIADQSRSNYSSTMYSLTSLLNMDYLGTLAPGHGDDAHLPPALLKHLIDHNAVHDLLKSEGYTLVQFDSGMTFTQLPTADLRIAPGASFSSFQRLLIDNTPLRHIGNPPNTRIKRGRWDPVNKDTRVPFILKNLANIPETAQPFIAMAHIYSPHVPHVLMPDGSPRRNPVGFIKGYTEELRFLNTKMIEAIDAIQKKFPDSVVIIQGDHGAWRYGMEPLPGWVSTPEMVTRDRTEILNAYCLPGLPEKSPLYPSITPVNSFRVVFNHYLGMNLPLLPDRTCVYEAESGPSFWVESIPPAIP